MKRQAKVYRTNGNNKKGICDLGIRQSKIKAKKSIKYDKRGQFLMLRAKIHNVDITVSNSTAITVVKQKLEGMQGDMYRNKLMRDLNTSRSKRQGQ